MNILSKEVLFADLDGTLIETASGATFANSPADIKFRIEAIKMVKKLASLGKLKAMAIVSNQGGVSKGYITKQDMDVKVQAVGNVIEAAIANQDNKVSVYAAYCASVDVNDKNRKPNTGMLDSTITAMIEDKLFTTDELDKSKMLMIGDASGKAGQFSDSDKKTAENFAIDYLDVADFTELMKSL